MAYSWQHRRREKKSNIQYMIPLVYSRHLWNGNAHVPTCQRCVLECYQSCSNVDNKYKSVVCRINTFCTSVHMRLQYQSIREHISRQTSHQRYLQKRLYEGRLHQSSHAIPIRWLRHKQ
jgi:hypothetical protein